jgi:hypothetical protein
VAGDLRRLHNEELLSLLSIEYYYDDELWKMGRVGYVERMKKFSD